MVKYEVIVKGNSFKLADTFFGFANLSLVHTRDGLILFDVGHYCNRRPLLKALEQRGLKPKDVSTVVLSHLHFDHSANMDLFTHARVVVSRREWDYADKPHEEDIAIPWKIRELLEETKLELVDGECDVATDCHFFPSPGHTPGSCAMALKTDQGTVVLAGDAIKYPKEWLRRKSDLVFDTQEHASQSISHILSIADVIVPGHYSPAVKCADQFVWEEDSAFHLVAR